MCPRSLLCFRPLLYICLPLTWFQCAKAQEAVKVEGTGFSVQDFGEGKRAFSNRSYIWQKVPANFNGWQYTQTAGGGTTQIKIHTGKSSDVFVATGPEELVAKGWQPTKWTFELNDKKHTLYSIYKSHVEADTSVEIPQANWSGTLVLAPQIQFQSDQPATDVPGVVIDFSPASTRVYIGSPSIAILPDQTYVASHDIFGPGTTNNHVRVFGSRDKGKSWTLLSEIDGQFWSNLFVHRGLLYLMGTNKENGAVIIRRSADGGRTWTTPADGKTGLLSLSGNYSTAPTPVVEHDGRLWRAMETQIGGKGRNYGAFMLSAKVDSDLLNTNSWSASRDLEFPHGAHGANTWLEGNAVVMPDGTVADILRVNLERGEIAAVARISPDGKTTTFDADKDFLDFPGGNVKFTIRFDPQTKRYWSLVNKQRNPTAWRNILSLISSVDARHWRVEGTVLEHPDQGFHAFQYVDWQFEGNDIIFVSRTAWDEAHTYHDANYLTFHRIENFRNMAKTKP